MGYGSEFGWLSAMNVTSNRQATEICSHIPLRPKRLALSLRYFTPRKFDFGRRSCTPPFAQNDIQNDYSVIFASHHRRPNGRRQSTIQLCTLHSAFCTLSTLHSAFIPLHLYFLPPNDAQVDVVAIERDGCAAWGKR